jgi:rhomboid protease GluP
MDSQLLQPTITPSQKPLLIEERRLVGTLITKSPKSNSFFWASGTILLMCLISIFYWQAPEGWAQLLPAIRSSVFDQHQWWRLVTAIFIHADLEHLLSNMFMLWIFSFFIFGYFGFSVYPVYSLLSAVGVNALAIATYGPETQLLGASGLVYVLGGIWLSLYFFIQRQYPALNRLIRVVGIALMIFAPTTFVPSTSYRTHAIGFAAGLLMGLCYFYKNKKQIRSHEVYRSTFVESSA